MSAKLKEVLAQPAQEQLMSDQINYGMSVTQGGRRIDPMSIYKEPEQEPVAVVAVNQSGGIRMEYQDGSAFDISKHVGQRFYTSPPQPEQEPVAVLFQDGSIVKLEDLEFVPEKSGQRVQMLCTAPQQRPWVGLTDEEIQPRLNGLPTQSIAVYARNIEAILKDKNT